jgi:hypothetical protein
MTATVYAVVLAHESSLKRFLRRLRMKQPLQYFLCSQVFPRFERDVGQIMLRDTDSRLAPHRRWLQPFIFISESSCTA